MLNIRTILIVGFLIRLLYSVFFFYKNGTEGFSDDWDYYNFANDIIAQGLMVPQLTFDSQIVGPAWPMVIAFLKLIFGDAIYPVIGLNILLSTSHIYLIYLLGLKLFNNKTIALIAAAWAVFYVPFFNFAPSLLKEVFNQFFFALCLLLLLKIKEAGNKIVPRALILFVLTYSFFIHGDERYFFYLPLIGLFLLIKDYKTIPFKTRAFQLITLGVLLLFTMLPWLYRNYVFYERPVILTIRTATFTDKILGYNLDPPHYDGISPYDYSAVPRYQAITDSLKAGIPVKAPGIKKGFVQGIQSALDAGIDVKAFSRSKHYWYEFIELWRPVRFKPGMLAHGFRFEKQWFWYSNIIYGISFGLLLPFMLYGLFIMLARRDRNFWILFSIILFHTVLHVFVTHVRSRYRYPIDSIVILTAIYGIYMIIDKFRKKIPSGT